MSDDKKASTNTLGRISESRSMDTKVKRGPRYHTHASAPERAPAFGSPLEDELAASICGKTLVEACGAPKEIARAGEVVESNGRRWARGEPANPVNRVRRIIERAKNPFAIPTDMMMWACLRTLRQSGPMPEWRWRSLMLQAFHMEQPHDSHEDVVNVGVLTGKVGLEELLAADSRVVRATLDRMALTVYGMLKKWSLQGVRGN